MFAKHILFGVISLGLTDIKVLECMVLVLDWETGMFL